MDETEIRRIVREELRDMLSPKIPASPPMHQIFPAPNYCGKCGLKVDGPLGYVCPQPQCPTGLGGAWCQA